MAYEPAPHVKPVVHPLSDTKRRALERLRTLDTILESHGAEVSVADLREQIRDALTAA